MKTHAASVHEEKKPIKCDICDYSCSVISTLKKLVVSVHEERRSQSNVTFVITVVL